MSLLCSPGGLPERITSGNTLYCLSRVGDRAYYTPHGYLIEDTLYCWCVNTESETGRVFFSNCGGLGECWALPDVFSENYRVAIAELHSSASRTLSSPPSPSPLTHTSSSRAVAFIDEEPRKPGPARKLFSLSSPSPHHRPLPPSPPSPSLDMCAKDTAYLREFGNAESAPSPQAPGTDQTPLVRQLRESVDAYADEVAELRRRLEEEKRLALEKEFALVEVEEWMVNMRLRMMDALETRAPR